MMTSAWQKKALVLFGLILSLVLLEAGMRLGGFVLLSIQEHKNLDSLRQKGAYRILCLGESTTQEQYPRFLEQILNRRNTGIRFSVIDKGRKSIDTDFILDQVESYLDEYHPDLVVTMMGINDKGKHMPLESATTSKWKLFIRSFKIYKLARLLWLHLLTKASEMGLCKSTEDMRNSWRVSAYLPKTRLKEAPILTEESFRKTIGLNSENDGAYVELGKLYRNRGEVTRAEDSYKKAIELNPENDHAHVELGRLYRERGELTRAEDSYKRAIMFNPKNNYAYLEIGVLCQDQGKFPQAENSFKIAAELHPENDRAYIRLGWLYRKQDKFSLAEDLFKKAIELNPKNHLVFEAMSSLYEEMGKLDLAKEYAAKAKQVRPTYYDSATVNNYHKLKEILSQQGIKLVCVQYPMRNVKPLMNIFEKNEGVIFVDNESLFKEALRKSNYKEYFSDMFGGDFGHCTQKGNELLAKNIADVILREAFNK